MMNYSGNEVSASKVFAGASCLGTTFNNRPAKFLPPVLTLRCRNRCFHHFFEPLHIRMVLLAVGFLSFLWHFFCVPLLLARRQLKSTTSTSERSRGNEYFGQILVLYFLHIILKHMYVHGLIYSHPSAIISTMSTNEHSRRNNFSSLLLSFRRKELFVFHL